MATYLTQPVFQVFWTGLKAKLRAKVDVKAGYSLTKNDLTDALKANYDAAFTNRVNSASIVGKGDTAAPTGAAISITESEGTRSLKVTLPTTLQDFINDDTNADNVFVTAGSLATTLGSYVTSTALSTTLQDYATNATIGNVDSGKTVVQMIGEAAAGKITKKIVQTLPTGAAINDNTIYLIAKASADGQTNIYDEYLSITKVTYEQVTPEGSENPSELGWFEDATGTTASADTTVDSGKTYYAASEAKALEKIGDTSIDLSGYVQRSEVETISQATVEAWLAEDTSEGATDAPASGD